MLQADIDYISEGIAEMYAELATMKYIPLDQNSTKPNRYGEVFPVFDEPNAFDVYGVLATEADKERDLDRKDPQSTHRIDGIIKLVFKQVKDKGIRITIGDGIDVLNEYGDFDRYVITGTDKKVEIPFVLTRLFVTKLSRLASE